MAQESLPLLSREWRESARNYADKKGLGSLDTLPPERWQAVLAHVELQMQTEGFVLPDRWQEALAQQVGRRKG
jgi:hypothetical protein